MCLNRHIFLGKGAIYMEPLKIAIVGATGMVGRMFLKVLEEKGIQARYTLFASSRSAGQKLSFMGESYTVEPLEENSFAGRGFRAMLFSAGGEVSRKFAPLAAGSGAVVIDNSSCWRMDPLVPLIVPQVNPESLPGYMQKGIIANPNCSTIQAVVALKPLADAFGLKRVVYSTYQSVSGAGKRGWEDLENGLRGLPPKKFPHSIANNCLPHIDVFADNGYTKEEIKMIEETRKILSLPGLPVTATCVRVPVFCSHSESINVELNRPFTMEEVFSALQNQPGLVIEDEPSQNIYPLATEAAGKDQVFVGRIRRDFSVENGLNLWCVADNLRKGAASNAVEILELLLKKWEAQA